MSRIGIKVDRTRASEYREAWFANNGKLPARLGFSIVELGRRFSHGGDVWEIVGINPKAGRYRIVCRHVADDELRRFSKTLVRACAPEFGSTR